MERRHIREGLQPAVGGLQAVDDDDISFRFTYYRGSEDINKHVLYFKNLA